MKHTKGPWNVLIYGSCNDFTYQIRKPKLMKNHEEARANAHLIAAAPEMLEALETYFRAYESDSLQALSAAQEKMKDSIEKARGES